jgi:hypothetical protein
MSTQAITVGEAKQLLSGIEDHLPFVDEFGGAITGINVVYIGADTGKRVAMVRNRQEPPCPCGCDTCNDCEKD